VVLKITMKQGKISLKVILVMVILIVVGVLGVLGVNTVKTFIGGAAAGNEPKNVIAKPLAKEAVVQWQSDKPSEGVVEYGTTPASLLLRAAESEAVTSHAVKLTPLKANTNYYFRIRVGEEIFDNSGIPWSFKSKGEEGTSAGVTVVPTMATSPSATASAMGGCNRKTDYNQDGVVNSLDYIYCLNREGKSASGSSNGTGACLPGKDYDGNGVVNSLDMIRCLQSRR